MLPLAPLPRKVDLFSRSSLFLTRRRKLDCLPSGHMALAAQASVQHETHTQIACVEIGAWSTRTNIRGHKLSCMYLDYSW